MSPVRALLALVYLISLGWTQWALHTAEAELQHYQTLSPVGPCYLAHTMEHITYLRRRAERLRTRLEGI